MPDNPSKYHDAISRRRFVELAGVSGAAALAGCDGSDSGDETPADEGTSDGVMDRTHVGALQANPTERTINPHHTQLSSEPARRLTQDRYAAYSFNEGEFILSALEDWEFEEETVTLTFRDDLTWSNGDQVTTEDIDVQFQILEKVGSAIWGYVESTEVVDDLTYQLNLTGPTNPTMVKFQLANMWIDTPAQVFEQFLDAEAVEIQQFMWEDTDNEVLTSGAWSYVDRNQQNWNFERNGEFRKADNVNFSEYSFDAYQEASVPQQDFTTGGNRFDSAWSMFAGEETVEGFADYVVENRSIRAKWGIGMLFNHDDPIFGDRAVRQAIAYVINRQEIVDNAGPRTKFPAEVPCGIAPADIDTWLGDRKSEYETYGVDSSETDAAETVLQDAGYEKVDGTWQNEDGEPVQAEYKTPSGWSDFTTATETIVDRLNEFGFDMTIGSQPTGDWQGSFIDGNFKVGAYTWMPGQARSSFPYFPLRHQIVLDQLDQGHGYPYDEEMTIPGLDEDEMTLVPEEKVEEIATQPTNEDAMPIVQEAAWHNNVDLPMLSLVSKFEQSWLTDDEWELVGEDDVDWSVKWPTFWLPREGKLTATQS